MVRDEVIEKKLFLNQDIGLSFSEFGDNNLYMYYDGEELCLAIDHYTKSHDFHVTHENDLYVPIKRLFNDLRGTDVLRTGEGNKFEWVSEGYGMPEGQNRLVIRELNGMYLLNFMKSKYNSTDKKNVCSICFSQTDSKNKDVARAFNKMFMNLCREEIVKSKDKGSHLK